MASALNGRADPAHVEAVASDPQVPKTTTRQHVSVAGWVAVASLVIAGLVAFQIEHRGAATAAPNDGVRIIPPQTLPGWLKALQHSRPMAHK